jgi:hypothetical protein
VGSAGRPIDQRGQLDQFMPLIDEVNQFQPEQVLLGGVMSRLRTHRRPRCSLQKTEGNWVSILQLASSAIARKANNGAGSAVVQGRLFTQPASRVEELLPHRWTPSTTVH